MVRSSGHHRKRSRSRSVTPDHKRSKSSRDYDKDRSRRRSRSRDRIRRSRSRDRKKDKKISESRVRSKPLKLKRRSRSRSRSRSKSKERSTKKDDKKDIKAEDEPFDPTNLDKVAGNEDEEWVVTDIIEEPTVEDNGTLEEEYDYEADEDDQYSHASSTSHHNSNHSSPDINNQPSEDISGTQENKETNKQDETLTVGKENTEKDDTSSNKKDDVAGKNSSEAEENVKNIVSSLKESSSLHKLKMKSFSTRHEAEKLNAKVHSSRSHNNSRQSEEVEKLTKDHVIQWIKLDKEFYELKMKHEIARHNAEMEAIRAQLQFWKNKC